MMMLHRIATLCLAACLACAASAARAETAFTFQGRLVAAGAPANGSYDFEFRLFNDATVGDQIGTHETASAVVVAAGVFSVLLDFGDGPFNSRPRWLEIAVREVGAASYTVLSPRQRIGAAPFAVEALFVAPGAVDAAAIQNGAVNAAHVQAGAIASAHIADGSVSSADLGGSSVDSSHIADGTITAADIAAAAVGSAQLEDGSISSVDIGHGSLLSEHILDGTIAASDIATNVINSAHVEDGSIQGIDIAANTVTGSNIEEGTIGAIHLGSGSVGAHAIVPGAVGSGQLGASSVEPRHVGLGLYAGKGSLYFVETSRNLSIGSQSHMAACLDANDLPVAWACQSSTTSTIRNIGNNLLFWAAEEGDNPARVECVAEHRGGETGQIRPRIYCVAVP